MPIWDDIPTDRRIIRKKAIPEKSNFSKIRGIVTDIIDAIIKFELLPWLPHVYRLMVSQFIQRMLHLYRSHEKYG